MPEPTPEPRQEAEPVREQIITPQRSTSRTPKPEKEPQREFFFSRRCCAFGRTCRAAYADGCACSADSRDRRRRGADDGGERAHVSRARSRQMHDAGRDAGERQSLRHECARRVLLSRRHAGHGGVPAAGDVRETGRAGDGDQGRGDPSRSGPTVDGARRSATRADT